MIKGMTPLESNEPNGPKNADRVPVNQIGNTVAEVLEEPDGRFVVWAPGEPLRV
jgi:hypothetical protein